MGDRAKGRDKGKDKKAAKAKKPGMRPHEQRLRQDTSKGPPASP